jgi:ABC-type sulfate/molybdate transport systems ATPase subunit
VALARALAREPAVLLLDEPLAALDAHTRAGVRAELAEVLAAFAIPTVIVTHDMRDAAALADRAVVLARGAIRQEGSIGELVAAPADPFVASFTGANVLPGTASAIGAGRVRVTLDGGGTVVVAGESAGRIQLVVHPWELRLAAGPPRGGGGVLERVVTAVVPDEGRARVRLGDVVVDAAPASAPRVGERCWVLIDPGSARVLPAGATDR